jgi:hypothetical protein
MPEEQGRLKVYGRGDVEVGEIVRYLADLKFAYESIVVFEAITDSIQRAEREFPFRLYPFGYALGWSLARTRAGRPTRDWPPSPEEITLLVPMSEQLVLLATRLESPGFWEFLGNLNPLEVLRKYLNDRHERRKDREYRQPAEARRLYLENMLLESKVIGERIRVLREAGATNRDLAPLLNGLLHAPLRKLDSHLDNNVIEHAEVKVLERVEESVEHGAPPSSEKS